MARSTSQTWAHFGLEAWTLGLEASAVIGLRTWKLAMGGAASGAEAQLMVDEKIKAAIDVQTALLSGQYGSDPLRAGRAVMQHYTRKTRANRLRLSKP